jgi:hypothetical protein
MKLSIRVVASLAALAAFSAEAADISGEWTATIVTAAGQRDYTYVFRQNGAKLIGTAKSQDGVVAIANGRVNNTTITFDENVTIEGRRAVLEYTGELVSDNEIKFKRQTKGTSYPVIQFVAARVTPATPP